MAASMAQAVRPTHPPMAVAINSAQPVFDSEGALIDAAIANQLNVLAGQVVEFARMRALDTLGRAASHAVTD